MLNFAEANLRDPGKDRLFIYIEPNDQPLRGLLEEHGFAAFPKETRKTRWFSG